MNRSQRIIIMVGLGLILLSGLFPAYEGEWKRTGDNLNKYLGYHFIFYPPSSVTVAKAFNKYSAFINESSGYYSMFNANIILSRFIIQILTTVLLTIGLLYLFKYFEFNKNIIKKIKVLLAIVLITILGFLIVKQFIENKSTYKKDYSMFYK